MKVSNEDFFSKCDQIRSFLRIWSHLLRKFLMENFTLCAVYKIDMTGAVSTLWGVWRVIFFGQNKGEEKVYMKTKTY